MVCFTLAFTVCFISVISGSAAQQFKHPGGWHTEDDILRIRQRLAEGREPWKSAADALLKMEPWADYKGQAMAEPHRGPGDNTGKSNLEWGSRRAYMLMLKWIATNDSSYGDAAIRVLDGWSDVLVDIKGKDAMLAAGIYGGKFAQTAELAAYYKPDWPKKQAAQNMFRNIFYPLIKAGSWVSWGTSCVVGMISMGVFCDDREMYNRALQSWNYGLSEQQGSIIAGNILFVGQLMQIAVTAYSQGDNLFGTFDNKLFAAFEYTAKYNLGYDVPFNNRWGFKSHGISSHARQLFPIYEMAHNYFLRVGQPSNWTKAARDNPGYAPEFTNFDHPGFGTLTHTLVPSDDQ